MIGILWRKKALSTAKIGAPAKIALSLLGLDMAPDGHSAGLPERRSSDPGGEYLSLTPRVFEQFS
jgi:hypothetical protein